MSDDVYYSRRKARKHAVEVGYSALVRDAEATELFDVTADEVGWRKHPWFAYAREVTAGVSDSLDELDELIEQSASWELERMARIDLAILRVGAWEILKNPEVPAAVAISEAVALANELSTDKSGAFINGVLSKIGQQI